MPPQGGARSPSIIDRFGAQVTSPMLFLRHLSSARFANE